MILKQSYDGKPDLEDELYALLEPSFFRDYYCNDVLNVKKRNHYYEDTILEEELVIELQKNQINFNKENIIIRKKSRIEKVIEDDDIENLRLLSNEGTFDVNQLISKKNQLYEYLKIPIILFCIEKHAMKCFKFLLIIGANPLKTITDFNLNRGNYSCDSKKINGMTFAVANGNLQMLKIIEENGGKIKKNCFNAATKFHQNQILKWMIQKNQDEQNMSFGLFSCAQYNNLEGMKLLLENELDVNPEDIIFQNIGYSFLIHTNLK